jgi:hypothetical protein
MPFADDLTAAAIENSHLAHAGAFYSSAEGLEPGTGLIFSGMTYPTFNPEQARFEARRGLILILTHECDIAPENERAFNEFFIAAPLILMSGFAEIFDTRRDLARNLAGDIASDKIHRMFFLPPTHQLLPSENLRLGAFIYLNALTSAHISQLHAEGVRPECALSAYGLEVLDRKLKNHLFRPPAQRLAVLT